jgi:HlyD family secretion protein
MSRKKKILIGLGALVIVVAGLIIIKSSGKNTVSKVTAEFVCASKGEINTIVTATGTIQPLKEVEVGTQVSGVVEKIYVDFNSHVTAGQLIAELDKTNLQASLADAKASLDNAINQQNYLQKIFDRQKALFESKLISEADYDDALYNLNNAINTVQQRQSALQRAQTNLNYASIYSPISGVVLSRAVELGQTVAASFNTPTLFTIAQDLTEMQVEADVDEADIGQVREGQRVTFTVDAFLGETFQGEVSQVRLNAKTTSSVVTYTVVINAKNPDLKLMPGMTATISIYTTELKDVITLPLSTVNYQADMNLMMQYHQQIGQMPPQPGEGEHRHFDGDSTRHMGRPNGNFGANMEMKQANDSTKTVWVKKDNKVVPQRIKIGKSNEINIEIKSGLAVGDSVLSSLKTDSPVLKTSGNASTGSPFMPRPPGRRR